MKSRQISRRSFLAAAATAVSAVVIVACNPGKSALQPGKSTSAPPLPLEPGREVKLLVVYDSVYGNTAQIAEALIAVSSIHPDSRVFKAVESTLNGLVDIDLLLVGSPTHGGTFTEPVKNFLAAIPAQGLQGMRAAAFDTSFSKETQKGLAKMVIGIFGFAAPKISEELTAKGATVIAAETFVVLDTEGPLQEGEIERAEAWVTELISAL
jgi:flavodoxin